MASQALSILVSTWSIFCTLLSFCFHFTVGLLNPFDALGPSYASINFLTGKVIIPLVKLPAYLCRQWSFLLFGKSGNVDFLSSRMIITKIECNRVTIIVSYWTLSIQICLDDAVGICNLETSPTLATQAAGTSGGRINQSLPSPQRYKPSQLQSLFTRLLLPHKITLCVKNKLELRFNNITYVGDGKSKIEASNNDIDEDVDDDGDGDDNGGDVTENNGGVHSKYIDPLSKCEMIISLISCTAAVDVKKCSCDIEFQNLMSFLHYRSALSRHEVKLMELGDLKFQYNSNETDQPSKFQLCMGKIALCVNTDPLCHFRFLCLLSTVLRLQRSMDDELNAQYMLQMRLKNLLNILSLPTLSMKEQVDINFNDTMEMNVNDAENIFSSFLSTSTAIISICNVSLLVNDSSADNSNVDQGVTQYSTLLSIKRINLRYDRKDIFEQQVHDASLGKSTRTYQCSIGEILGSSSFSLHEDNLHENVKVAPEDGCRGENTLPCCIQGSLCTNIISLDGGSSSMEVSCNFDILPIFFPVNSHHLNSVVFFMSEILSSCKSAFTLANLHQRWPKQITPLQLSSASPPHLPTTTMVNSFSIQCSRLEIFFLTPCSLPLKLQLPLGRDDLETSSTSTTISDSISSLSLIASNIRCALLKDQNPHLNFSVGNVSLISGDIFKDGGFEKVNQMDDAFFGGLKQSYRRHDNICGPFAQIDDVIVSVPLHNSLQNPSNVDIKSINDMLFQTDESSLMYTHVSKGAIWESIVCNITDGSSFAPVIAEVGNIQLNLSQRDLAHIGILSGSLQASFGTHCDTINSLGLNSILSSLKSFWFWENNAAFISKHDENHMKDFIQQNRSRFLLIVHRMAVVARWSGGTALREAQVTEMEEQASIHICFVPTIKASPSSSSSDHLIDEMSPNTSIIPILIFDSRSVGSLATSYRLFSDCEITVDYHGPIKRHAEFSLGDSWPDMKFPATPPTTDDFVVRLLTMQLGKAYTSTNPITTLSVPYLSSQKVITYSRCHDDRYIEAPTRLVISSCTFPAELLANSTNNFGLGYDTTHTIIACKKIDMLLEVQALVLPLRLLSAFTTCHRMSNMLSRNILRCYGGGTNIANTVPQVNVPETLKTASRMKKLSMRTCKNGMLSPHSVINVSLSNGFNVQFTHEMKSVLGISSKYFELNTLQFGAFLQQICGYMVSLYIVDHMLPSALHKNYLYEYDTQGARCRIDFVVSSLAGEYPLIEAHAENGRLIYLQRPTMSLICYFSNFFVNDIVAALKFWDEISPEDVTNVDGSIESSMSSTPSTSSSSELPNECKEDEADNPSLFMDPLVFEQLRGIFRFSASLRLVEGHVPLSSCGVDSLVVAGEQGNLFMSAENAPLSYLQGPLIHDQVWQSELDCVHQALGLGKYSLECKEMDESHLCGDNDGMEAPISHTSSSIWRLAPTAPTSKLWSFSSKARWYLIPPPNVEVNASDNFEMMLHVLKGCISTWCNRNEIGMLQDVFTKVIVNPPPPRAPDNPPPSGQSDLSIVIVDIWTDSDISLVLSQGQYTSIVFCIQQNFMEVNSTVPDTFFYPKWRTVPVGKDIYSGHCMEGSTENPFIPPLLSSVPIKIKSGSIKIMSNLPEYYDFFQHLLSVPDPYTTSDSVPQWGFHHNHRRRLFENSKFSECRTSNKLDDKDTHSKIDSTSYHQLGDVDDVLYTGKEEDATHRDYDDYNREGEGEEVMTIHFEDLFIDFYRRQHGGGFGMDCYAMTVVISSPFDNIDHESHIRIDHSHDDFDGKNPLHSTPLLSSRSSPAFTSATYPLCPYFMHKQVFLPLDSIILWPRVTTFSRHEQNDSSSKEDSKSVSGAAFSCRADPQLRYRQQGVANLRQCFVDMCHSAFIVDVDLVYAAINFFMEPINLTYARSIKLIEKLTSNTIELSYKLDFSMMMKEMVFCFRDKKSDTGKEGGDTVLCIENDLCYTHAWRGFLQTGPGFTTIKVDVASKSIFISPVDDASKALGTESLIEPTLFSLSMDFAVQPQQSHKEKNTELITKLMLFPQDNPFVDLSLLNCDSKPRASRCILLSIQPLMGLKKTPSSLWLGGQGVGMGAYGDEMVTADASTSTVIKVSLKDLALITSIISEVREDIKHRYIPPPLTEVYPIAFRSFRDVEHLPLLTYYHSHTVVDLRCSLDAERVASNFCDFFVILRNNTYNLLVAQSIVRRLNFSYRRIMDSLDLQANLNTSLWTHNEDAGVWEPVLEPVFMRLSVASDKPGSTLDASTSKSSSHPRGVRIDAFIDPVEFTTSYRAISSLSYKLSLADVITTSSVKLPPYKIINMLGVEVTCCLSSGNQPITAEEIGVGASLPIDIGLLAEAADLQMKLKRKWRPKMGRVSTSTIASTSKEHSLDITFSVGDKWYESKETVPIGREGTFPFALEAISGLSGGGSGGGEGRTFSFRSSTPSSKVHSSSETPNDSLFSTDTSKHNRKNKAALSRERIPHVLVSMSIKDDGGRELILHSILSFRNHTSASLYLLVRNSSDTMEVTLAPGCDWNVPVHLAHQTSTLYMKRKMDGEWEEAISDFGSLLLQGQWGTPLKLAAEIVRLADIQSPFPSLSTTTSSPSSSTDNNYFNARKTAASMPFSSSTPSKNLSASMNPREAETGDAMKSWLLLLRPDARDSRGNVGAALPIRYPTSSNHLGKISSRVQSVDSSSSANPASSLPSDHSNPKGDAPSSSTRDSVTLDNFYQLQLPFRSRVSQSQPLTIHLLPPLQICNLVGQPILYRIASKQGLVLCEGTLSVGVVTDLHTLPLLFMSHIYISVRMINYKWSKWTLLLDKSNPYPSSERITDITLQSMDLVLDRRAPGQITPADELNCEDNLNLPSLDITLNLRENFAKLSSPVLIANKTGMTLDFCEASHNDRYSTLASVVTLTDILGRHEVSNEIPTFSVAGVADELARNVSKVDIRNDLDKGDMMIDSKLPRNPAHNFVTPLRTISRRTSVANTPAQNITVYIHLPGNHLQQVILRMTSNASLSDVFERVKARVPSQIVTSASTFSSSFATSSPESCFHFFLWRGNGIGNQYVEHTPAHEVDMMPVRSTKIGVGVGVGVGKEAIKYEKDNSIISDKKDAKEEEIENGAYTDIADNNDSSSQSEDNSRSSSHDSSSNSTSTVANLAPNSVPSIPRRSLFSAVSSVMRSNKKGGVEAATNGVGTTQLPNSSSTTSSFASFLKSNSSTSSTSFSWPSASSSNDSLPASLSMGLNTNCLSFEPLNLTTTLADLIKEFSSTDSDDLEGNDGGSHSVRLLLAHSSEVEIYAQVQSIRVEVETRESQLLTMFSRAPRVTYRTPMYSLGGILPFNPKKLFGALGFTPSLCLRVRHIPSLIPYLPSNKSRDDSSFQEIQRVGGWSRPIDFIKAGLGAVYEDGGIVSDILDEATDDTPQGSGRREVGVCIERGTGLLQGITAITLVPKYIFVSKLSESIELRQMPLESIIDQSRKGKDTAAGDVLGSKPDSGVRGEKRKSHTSSSGEQRESSSSASTSLSHSLSPPVMLLKPGKSEVFHFPFPTPTSRPLLQLRRCNVEENVQCEDDVSRQEKNVGTDMNIPSEEKSWVGEVDVTTVGVVYCKLRNRGHSLSFDRRKGSMIRDAFLLIKVNVEMVGGSLLATFSEHTSNWPPYRLENLTSIDIRYSQLFLKKRTDVDIGDVKRDYMGVLGKRRGSKGIEMTIVNTEDEKLKEKVNTVNETDNETLAGARAPPVEDDADSSMYSFLQLDSLPSRTVHPFYWDHPVTALHTLQLEFAQDGQWKDSIAVNLDELSSMQTVMLQRTLPTMTDASLCGSLLYMSCLANRWISVWAVLKDDVVYLFRDEGRDHLVGVVNLSRVGEDDMIQLASIDGGIKSNRNGKVWDVGGKINSTLTFLGGWSGYDNDSELNEGSVKGKSNNSIALNYNPSSKLSNSMDLTKYRLLMLRLCDRLGLFKNKFEFNEGWTSNPNEKNELKQGQVKLETTTPKTAQASEGDSGASIPVALNLIHDLPKSLSSSSLSFFSSIPHGIDSSSFTQYIPENPTLASFPSFSSLPILPSISDSASNIASSLSSLHSIDASYPISEGTQSLRRLSNVISNGASLLIPSLAEGNDTIESSELERGQHGHDQAMKTEQVTESTDSSNVKVSKELQKLLRSGIPITSLLSSVEGLVTSRENVQEALLEMCEAADEDAADALISTFISLQMFRPYSSFNTPSHIGSDGISTAGSSHQKHSSFKTQSISHNAPSSILSPSHTSSSLSPLTPLHGRKEWYHSTALQICNPMTLWDVGKLQNDFSPQDTNTSSPSFDDTQDSREKVDTSEGEFDEDSCGFNVILGDTTHSFKCFNNEDMKGWIRACRRSVEKVWISDTIGEVSNQFSEAPPTSSQQSSVEVFKIKVNLRIRADGPTKVLEITEDEGHRDGDRSRANKALNLSFLETNNTISSLINDRMTGEDIDHVTDLNVIKEGQSGSEAGAGTEASAGGVGSLMTGEDNSLKVSIHVTSLSLSVIDSEPVEVLYIRLSDLEVGVMRAKRLVKVEGKVKELQVNSQLLNPAFPVVLFPNKASIQKSLQSKSSALPGGLGTDKGESLSNAGFTGSDVQIPAIHVFFQQRYYKGTKGSKLSTNTSSERANQAQRGRWTGPKARRQSFAPNSHAFNLLPSEFSLLVYFDAVSVWIAPMQLDIGTTLEFISSFLSFFKFVLYETTFNIVISPIYSFPLFMYLIYSS